MFIDPWEWLLNLAIVFVVVAILVFVVHDVTETSYERGFTAGTKQAIVLPPIEVVPDTIDLGELKGFGLKCYYVRDDQ